ASEAALRCLDRDVVVVEDGGRFAGGDGGYAEQGSGLGPFFFQLALLSEDKRIPFLCWTQKKRKSWKGF
ncbi:hypothetical protein U1Q18_002715, partial [Sarracenia purpurea var. burkii]